MINPGFLKKGDRIGIIAPASPPDSEKLDRGILFLENWGFEVELAPHLKEVRGYLAGDDRDRIDDLHKIFADKKIDGIWVAGGGYGIPRILSMINFDLIKSNPKPFIGYSDITALHLAINKYAELITYHGPMVATEFGNNPDDITLEGIKQVLFHDYNIDLLKEFAIDRVEIINSGSVKGRLTGGNLALLAATIGTPYEVETEGNILFFEDIGEEPYNIDRMLSQLKNAGKLKKPAGVIIGNFTDCKTESYHPSLTIDQVIGDYFSNVSYPVLRGVPFGHDKTQLTLPSGALAEIDTDNYSIKIGQ